MKPALRRATARSVGAAWRRWLWSLGACALLMPAGASEPGLLVGRVARVHDGDSLSLRQGRHAVMVRLAAIDAPELSQPHGQAARDVLHDCAFGRLVTVRVSSTDRFGRSVGVIDSSGRDCALLLVRAGLAWHARGFSGEQRFPEQLAYAQAEREARRRRIGLWADAAPQAPWEYRRHSPSRSAAVHR